jgi:hypothetical protein
MKQRPPPGEADEVPLCNFYQMFCPELLGGCEALRVEDQLNFCIDSGLQRTM